MMIPELSGGSLATAAEIVEFLIEPVEVSLQLLAFLDELAPSTAAIGAVTAVRINLDVHRCSGTNGPLNAAWTWEP